MENLRGEYEEQVTDLRDQLNQDRQQPGSKASKSSENHHQSSPPPHDYRTTHNGGDDLLLGEDQLSQGALGNLKGTQSPHVDDLMESTEEEEDLSEDEEKKQLMMLENHFHKVR